MFQSGNNHKAVNSVKAFLNSHNSVSINNLRFDNSFDKNTQNALASFQKFKNLSPTGRMNLKTWLAIGAEMDPISINVISMSDKTLRDLLQAGYRSRFPFKKFSSNNANSSAIHTSSSSFFSSQYSFTYTVYVSVFAPFDWFGPLGWSKGDGDKRPFGMDRKATYRLRAESTRIASPGHHTFPWSKTTASDATTSVLWMPLYADSVEQSEGYIDEDEDIYLLLAESDTLDYHLSGNDDAFALWGDNSLLTSDIDVHPNISFHYEPQADPKKILMRATGKITGDQFPAVESFVLDRNLNGVMLGVWQIPEGAGPVISQDWWLGIEGDRNLPMIDIDVTIVVENGIFTGIIKNGRTISLAEHNQVYTSLPPVKKG